MRRSPHDLAGQPGSRLESGESDRGHRHREQHVGPRRRGAQMDRVRQRLEVEHGEQPDHDHHDQQHEVDHREHAQAAEPPGAQPAQVADGDVHDHQRAERELVEARVEPAPDQPRHLLAVVLWRPAQQAEEIDESFWQETGVTVGGHTDHGSVTSLRELGSVGGDQQGQVRELRRSVTGGLEDEHVLEGVGEMVLAADDVTNAQVGVVGA